MTTKERINPAMRGYHAVYRENDTNRCPGCNRSHWYIGRISAECAFCGTTLPLEAPAMTQPRIIERKGFHKPMLSMAY